MTSPALQSDARIVVPPFTEHPDGSDVIIANLERSAFLAVPAEAVTLLHLLADGHTIGEAATAYQQQYGVTPDIDDFLDSLGSAGFLQLQLQLDLHTEPEPAPRYHFQTIPVRLAQRIWSWPVLAGCGALIALALLATVLEPSIVPAPSDLVFQRDPLLLSLVLIGLSLVTVFVHELAHLVAARAAGVPARMGISHRLWVLVAETDMTGIWLAPRRQRCLAFVAGMIFDLVLSAVLALALFADRRGWLGLDPTLLLLVRGLLFVQLTRLLFELYVFVPTDVYYVLGTLCGCRNLMGDTQAYLLNQLWRLLRSPRRIDQSAVPAREMRVVRAFVWAWLVGRVLAFASLFLITLPVMAGYLAVLGRGATGDAQALRPLLEGPGLPILMFALQSAGIVLWLCSMLRARGQPT